MGSLLTPHYRSVAQEGVPELLGGRGVRRGEMDWSARDAPPEEMVRTPVWYWAGRDRVHSLHHHRKYHPPVRRALALAYRRSPPHDNRYVGGGLVRPTMSIHPRWRRIVLAAF